MILRQVIGVIPRSDGSGTRLWKWQVLLLSCGHRKTWRKTKTPKRTRCFYCRVETDSEHNIRVEGVC